MRQILEREYFHNTVQDYLIVLAMIFIGLVIIRSFKKIVLKQVKKWTKNTHTHIDDFIISAVERFGIPALYYSVFYIALNYLTLSTKVDYVIKIITTVAITILAVRLISTTILVVLKTFIRRQEHGEEKVKQLGGLMLLINVIIWVTGFLFLADNLGYNITAIIAGLGIGGIAIALAAQNILGDLFNYFVIFFDRPFEIGDMITIDNKTGEVDYIGIKTTRIRSITGEQLIIANSDLTNSRIHNFKRLEKRRVDLNFGVVYQTSPEKLRMIPDIIKSVTDELELVELTRAHFSGFGASSLDFKIVYHILDPDYITFMNLQQAVNLRVFEEFLKNEIEFAYPTQTLFLNREEKSGEVVN